MKKILFFLLLTSIALAQTNATSYTKLKITANPEKTTATRVVVQDATTGEVGYVTKSTLATDISGKENTITAGTTSQYYRGDKTWQTLPTYTLSGLGGEPSITAGTTAQYYRGDKTWQTLNSASVGLNNVNNTTDANKPISTATQTALNTKENTSNKNIANGYAGLGSDGKLFSTQLPSITISDTFVIGTQAAMLALSAETGDVAVRTDLNKSYILKGTDPTVLANWQELLTPTSSVTSVFGRQGAVTANTGDYTADQINETASRKFQTLAQQTYNDATSSIQTQLNSKEPAIAAPGTVGQYWRGNKTFATLDTSVVPENVQLYFTDARARTAVTGNSGTTNYIPKFTGSGTLGNSLIYDNGTNVGIGTTSPNHKLVISNGGNNGFEFNPTNGEFFTFNRATSLYTQMNLYSNIFTLNTPTSEAIRITSSGNVGIGTTTPSQKLEVSGNVLATGFFQSSDSRLKDIISKDGDVIKYKWKDKRDDKIHIGYIAQEVQKENPEQVNADEKGMLSVNYIEILVEKIRKLEKEIELLKIK